MPRLANLLYTVRQLLPALCLLALAVRAVAAESEEKHSRPGVLHLSLDSAIRMALARNYSIFVQSYNPRIAQQEVTRARGQFDPVLELGASRLETSARSFANGRVSATRTITRNDVLVDANLSGTTPFGTTYRFGLNSVNNTGSGLRFAGDYASTGGLQLSQPLLRGFGLDVNLYRIRIAKNNVLVSEWRMRQQLIDTLTQLIYVYNDLHLASENLAVAQRSQGLARQLFQDNTKKMQIGVMKQLDVTEASAEVASREEGVILARRQQLDNENLLKQLVTRDLEQMLDIRVEIERPPSPQFKVDVRGGIDDALHLRPDYRQAILDLQRQNVTVKFAENGVLPKLDLTGSLNLLGFDNDFATSVGRIGRRDSNAWSAGFLFSYPLGNHEAKADLNAARLNAAQGLVELQRIEQQLIVQIDNAGGQIISDRARIESTSEAVRLARETMDASAERLRLGAGTTFEVLDLQRRLAENEYAEALARSDYNKAVAEFYRQTGTTLQVYRVDVH